MKIVDKKWYTEGLQWLITITMAIGTVIVLALPFVVKWMLQYYEITDYDNQYYITCLCFLYPSGILGLAVLHQARKLLISVNKNQPFVRENVRRIKYVARISAVLCGIYAVGIFFMHSFFVPILFVMFGLIALFFSIFGELFRKAVEYKDDNDFTI